MKCQSWTRTALGDTVRCGKEAGHDGNHWGNGPGSRDVVWEETVLKPPAKVEYQVGVRFTGYARAVTVEASSPEEAASLATELAEIGDVSSWTAEVVSLNEVGP